MTDFMNIRWDHFPSNSSSSSRSSATRVTSVRAAKDYYSTPSPAKRRRKQRVQFEEKIVSSIVVLEENQVPPNIIWYSSKEFQETTKELQAMIRQARHSGNPLLVYSERVQQEFRGLEDLLSTRASQERKNRMRSMLQVVLNEQKRQVAVKRRDPILLGKFASEASRSSRDQAWMRASLDARAAYPLGVPFYER